MGFLLGSRVGHVIGFHPPSPSGFLQTRPQYSRGLLGLNYGKRARARPRASKTWLRSNQVVLLKSMALSHCEPSFLRACGLPFFVLNMSHLNHHPFGLMSEKCQGSWLQRVLRWFPFRAAPQTGWGPGPTRLGTNRKKRFKGNHQKVQLEHVQNPPFLEPGFPCLKKKVCQGPHRLPYFLFLWISEPPGQRH